MREGIVRLLAEAGFDVVAQAGDADDLLRKALAHHPDVVVTDVQMPPGPSDDGLRAALELRRQRPETAVLVLSQFYEEHYALDLIGERPEGVGYLLKERVGDVEAFVASGRARRGGRERPRSRGRRRGCSGAAGAAGPLDQPEPPRARRARRRWPKGSRTSGIAEELVVTRGRGREARDPHLPQARARPDADRAPARARRADLPARLREVIGGYARNSSSARLTSSGWVQPMLCGPPSTRTSVMSAIRSGSRSAVASIGQDPVLGAVDDQRGHVDLRAGPRGSR